MPTDADLAYYAAPGPLTDFGAQTAAIADAPADVAGLAKYVQNLLVHRAWANAYRIEPDAERLTEEGLHGAEAMIACALRLSDTPLAKTRFPDKRMIANCRHFSTLMTALLRHRSVPARARCGFGTYFEAGKHVDHWVCEYWNAEQGRWILVDAQLDGLQQAVLKPDFDPLDVPRERFWVAGQAWTRVRAGEADGETFGIFDMWGAWFIGGDLRLDIASLNKIELLPWDVQHMTTPIDEAEIDRVAALTTGDDAAIAEVRALYAATPSLQVPDSLMAQIVETDAAGVGMGFNPIATSVD